MSANVETMFSVREKPWHGLGEIVDTAPTSKDAIWMAGLDWKVESRNIYDQFGQPIPNYKANVRDKDNQVLGIVSDRYTIVQNEEAFNFTDSLLDEGVTYETAGSLKNGKIVWLLAKMPDTKILDDKFEPYVCFTNTHDGTGAVRVCCTPIRVVCNNTLNIALSTAKRSWSTIHKGDIQSKLNEARVTLGLAELYMDKLSEEAERLATVKISEAEIEHIFDMLYPINYVKDTQRKIQNTLQLKENLFKCYLATDIAIYYGTAWGILNACTDLVAHTAPARLTTNYQENNWGKIMTGHPFVDNFYKGIQML